MIIYNVTIKLEHIIADEWVSWMKVEHMDDLVRTGMFTGYRLCRLLEQDEADGITYSAQYYCNSMEDYHNYIENFSGEMRDKALKRFAGKFIAFRSVMEEV